MISLLDVTVATAGLEVGTGRAVKIRIPRTSFPWALKRSVYTAGAYEHTAVLIFAHYFTPDRYDLAEISHIWRYRNHTETCWPRVLIPIICYLCAPIVAVSHRQAGFGPPRAASERLGTLSAAHRHYSSRGARSQRQSLRRST